MQPLPMIRMPVGIRIVVGSSRPLKAGWLRVRVVSLIDQESVTDHHHAVHFTELSGGKVAIQGPQHARVQSLAPKGLLPAPENIPPWQSRKRSVWSPKIPHLGTGDIA